MVKVILENLFEGTKMASSQQLKNGKDFTRMDFINMQNIDGLTAIHYATFRGNIKIIQYLVD